MSEKVLRILLRLFAKLALLDGVTEEEVAVVRNFLDAHLPSADIPPYMDAFEGYVVQGDDIPVRQFCEEVAGELSQRQQFLILVYLLELIYADLEISEGEMAFWREVEAAFKLDPEDVSHLMAFVWADSEAKLPDVALRCAATSEGLPAGVRYLHAPLHGTIAVLNLGRGAFYLLKYFGQDYLQLNHQYLAPRKNHVLGHGSVLGLPHGQSLYFSDIARQYMELPANARVQMDVRYVSYEFASGRKGLHSVALTEESGKLVAIMGASGSGKSTLLNVLNGNLRPSAGKVLVNGQVMHENLAAMKGLIGYVPQDDLLIEELTVYQNLLYNAKLCYKDHSPAELDTLVMKVLTDLGLTETRDLKVGNSLNKTISGGQRKRLNIGLELLRAPAIIFFDEPTSGLSSRDSENIMDLLKELTFMGKLVFVVIHQPSSDIFKLFDSLLVLDTGGYPIYYGNPVEAVVYFKQASAHIDRGQPSCPECGTINPEQIFNIIETRVTDEFGNPTDRRKVTPAEWNEVYRKDGARARRPDDEATATTPLPGSPRSPGWLRQLGVFFRRDLLAKLGNKQYLGINIIQAPLLALILAVFVRQSGGESYLFGQNDNIPAFFFMSIVVALFTGMTMSAEEIFRDRKILKRESFLNLSRSGYLLSKVSILFGFSALQMASFVAISAFILAIPGLYVEYWLLVFSLACFAIMLGLNVSATFDSAVTIYILIPLMLIPQLILSGTVVKFDELNPSLSSPRVVPLAADAMASRWAYEGMMVKFFVDNAYEREFFAVEQKSSEATYYKDYWLPKLQDYTAYCLRHQGEPGDSVRATYDSRLAVLRAEVAAQQQRTPKLPFVCADSLAAGHFSSRIAQCLDDYYVQVQAHYVALSGKARTRHDEIDRAVAARFGDADAYTRFRQQQHNEAIDKLVRNADSETRLQEVGGALLRRFEPIYNPSTGLGYRTHFFAANKRLFGLQLDTFTFNLIVIWLMTLGLYITLHLELWRKILHRLSRKKH